MKQVRPKKKKTNKMIDLNPNILAKASLSQRLCLQDRKLAKLQIANTFV